MSPLVRTLIAAGVVLIALLYFATLAGAGLLAAVVIGVIGAAAVLAFGHIAASKRGER